MEDVIAPIAVFGGFYFIIKLCLDYSMRRKLINKGMVDERVKYLFEDYAKVGAMANIKWGMVLLGIGLALIFGQFAPYTLGDEGMFGLMFIFAGLGFLIYYFYASKKLKESQQDRNRSDSIG